jgi:nitrogen fixation-related uncharacterized protein
MTLDQIALFLIAIEILIGMIGILIWWWYKSKEVN